MAHEPNSEEVRVFAQQHALTEDQARQLLSEHGHDEGELSQALESLRHFLKAPS